MIDKEDFLCRCSDEGKERCDQILAQARELVSKGREISDLEFVERMIWWITSEGTLNIYTDHWGLVCATPFEGKNTYDIKESINIQCDEIIDGLAGVIVYVWGKDGKT